MKTQLLTGTILSVTLGMLFGAENNFVPSPGFREVRVLFAQVDGEGNTVGGRVQRNEFALKRGRYPDAPLRVNISNDYAMGTQDDAQGSVWMAATVASMLSGKPLNGYDLTIRFTGESGGPSAGAVYCLNFLSALMRQEFPEDVVMTGTIAPDGGIGPVSGIPYKLWAAKADGFKRAIIPLFSAAEEFKDPTTGQSKLVDPVEFGRSLGLEVKPAETIAEAYEWLFDIPLRKMPKALPPIRYSPKVEAALRKDCDALSKTLQSVITSDSFQKHHDEMTKENHTFYTKAFEQAKSTLSEQASLLSVRHQNLKESISPALALEKWVAQLNEFYGASPSQEQIIHETSKLRKELADAATQRVALPPSRNWTELQVSPDISKLVEAFETASQSNVEDLQALNAEDLQAQYASALFQYSSQQQAFDLNPLSNVISELAGASSDGANPDISSVRNLLNMLLTTIQASVKTAQTTGLQRVNDDNVPQLSKPAYTVWVKSGKWMESQSENAKYLAEQTGSASSLIRGCYKAMDVLAGSSAAYVVFETIGAHGMLDDKQELIMAEEQWPILQMDNTSYASRIISGAKKNAEAEIGKLLLRSESVVMPVYYFELGEDAGQAGAISAYGVFGTLTCYYKAYLYAWLMNTFLDMEEGKFI